MHIGLKPAQPAEAMLLTPTLQSATGADLASIKCFNVIIFTFPLRINF